MLCIRTESLIHNHVYHPSSIVFVLILNFTISILLLLTWFYHLVMQMQNINSRTKTSCWQISPRHDDIMGLAEDCRPRKTPDFHHPN